MPSVYFHIDEVARDAVVASALKRKLAAFGISLVYGNRVESAQMNRIDPFDLYIFPSIDLFKAYFPESERPRGLVYILPSESVGGLTSNTRRLAAKYFGSFPEEYRPWTERIAAFCLWGPSHVKSFEEYGPHLLDKVHVIGHPRFDASCRGSDVQHGGRVRVGLISRFAGLNPFNRVSMLSNIYCGRRSYYADGRVTPRFAVHADRDWEDYLYNEAIDLRLLFEIVQALGDADVELELRVHPRENRNEWEVFIAQHSLPLKIAPWDIPFQHWVGKMNHVIGPTSTSFFDCFAMGKRPICTNALAPRRSEHVIAGGDDDNPILKFVHMPTCIEELVDAAKRRPQENVSPGHPEELLHILEQEAGYPSCDISLTRLARICADHLAAVPTGGKTISRILHRFLMPAANINQVLRYGWRAGTEQSSSFLLTPSRKRWIDELSRAANVGGPS